MNKGRVFISHEPMRLVGARPVPAFPLSYLKPYGSIEFLLKWSEAQRLSSEQILWKMRKELSDYCSSDYLLLVGSPRTFAPAIMAACESNSGCCRVLTWNRGLKRYDLDTYDSEIQPPELRA